ncbi:hypothetical protein DM02DRAFT_258216 [Periconia macrospinosa]|uniref:Uncharacterized protein n=1 Tax=Periconia macrospinosa TaxID=97972 RepID=A0A2V1DYW0_9PLEO|nr:hypothetical protein DM02DRAFT_258216 [Periconia macrospinosa]
MVFRLHVLSSISFTLASIFYFLWRVFALSSHQTAKKPPGGGYTSVLTTQSLWISGRTSSDPRQATSLLTFLFQVRFYSQHWASFNDTFSPVFFLPSLKTTYLVCAVPAYSLLDLVASAPGSLACWILLPHPLRSVWRIV